MLDQFLRFLVVGGAATAIHYLLMWLLHAGLGLDAVLSTAVGFLISAVFNFLASYHFTYRSSAPKLRAAWRYALVAGSGLCINTGIFAMGTRGGDLPVALAQIIATGVVLFWQFGMGRVFSFSDARQHCRVPDRTP